MKDVVLAMAVLTQGHTLHHCDESVCRRNCRSSANTCCSHLLQDCKSIHDSHFCYFSLKLPPPGPCPPGQSDQPQDLQWASVLYQPQAQTPTVLATGGLQSAISTDHQGSQIQSLSQGGFTGRLNVRQYLNVLLVAFSYCTCVHVSNKCWVESTGREMWDNCQYVLNTVGAHLNGAWHLCL